MPIIADYDFNDYGLGFVASATLLGTMRGCLQEAFDAFAEEAEWWFTETGCDDSDEVTHMWLTTRDGAKHWGLELPLRITLTPDEMQTAILRSVDELMCNDGGQINAGTKAKVLHSLAAFRAAIDAAEQAVNAKEVTEDATEE